MYCNLVFCKRSNWNVEPNDSGDYGEDCAYLTSDGVYNDNNCFTRISYVCELETSETFFVFLSKVCSV